MNDKITTPKEAFYAFCPKGIRAKGWIEKQMREDGESGWIPTCNKMSHEGILAWDPNSRILVPYYPPPKKWLYSGREAWNKSVPYWQPLIDKLGVYGEGEFQGHWMDMLFRMVWVGGINKFRNLAHRCVEEILKSAEEDGGYIGVDLPQVRFTGNYITPFGLQNGDFEISGMGSVFDALLTYHRFTGDSRVLRAVEKAALLMVERTNGKEKMGHSGGALMVNPLTQLYRLTGRKEFLIRAKAILDFCFTEHIGEAEKMRDKKPHVASIGINLLAALDYWRVTGDPEIIAYVKDVDRQVTDFALQAPGAPTGHGEYLHQAGAGVNMESCGNVWWPWFWIEMVKLTGEARYADLAEKCIFNALPGCRAKDGSAWAYFTRPNQLFAARSAGQGTVYGARLLVECCGGNIGRMIPVMAENMVASDSSGGFVLIFYGPCRVKGSFPATGKFEITENTGYPFSEHVDITIKFEKKQASFLMKMRMPDWCDFPRLAINGVGLSCEAKDSWLCLRRRWKTGDIVRLTFPMKVAVDRDKNGTAVVRRGPLVYALPVSGKKVRVDKWGSFEEIITTGSKWNYALCLDKKNPSSSFRLKTLKVPDDSCVWEHPPFGLEVTAVRLPDWKLDRKIESMIPSKSTDIPEPLPPVRPFHGIAGAREKIVLVPYGFTTLRMTHLPVV